MTNLPASLIPQPPAGTDVLIFEFHHDDYDSSIWAPDPTVLPAPGHTRMATWVG